MTDFIKIEDFVNERKLSALALDKECKKLIDFAKKDEINSRSFVGNNLIYHFNFENLIKARRNKKLSFYDIITDVNKEEYIKLLNETEKRDRTGTMTKKLYECYRVNRGAIVFFKSAQAILCYKNFNAKKVLDFTMGWGGRLLGAWAMGIDYIGIDCNICMKSSYENMIETLQKYDKKIGRPSPKMEIIWKSCLDVDYSKLDYDFVLTSPPYYNLEIYECMGKLWAIKDDFYKNFMKKIFNKINDNFDGVFCLNISPKMFEEFSKYIDEKPIGEIDLKQQLGNQKKKSKDLIYCYRKNSKINEERKKNKFNELIKNAIDYANMNNINKDELIKITKNFIENNM